MKVKLELKRTEPIRRQITDRLREQILANELPAGSRLPSAEELAREWGTNAFTVHSALVPLVKEGLIERRRRVGSFIRSNKPVAAMVLGIYCCESFWDLNHLGFVRAVQDALRKKMGERGYKVRLMIDHRPSEQQHTPPAYLLQAIEEKAICGLAILLGNWNDEAWIRKLSLPVSMISSGTFPNRVIPSDSHQFLELALDRLQAQGCRSAGFISPHNTLSPAVAEQPDHPYLRIFDEYMAMCRSRGMEIRNSWIRAPHGDVDNHELFGYAECLKLCRETERPDGIIVSSDVVALGAMKALAETNGPRPKLVLHRNRGVSLPFPSIAANWISTDIDLVADGLIDQIMRQAAGEEVSPVRVPLVISDREQLASEISDPIESREMSISQQL